MSKIRKASASPMNNAEQLAGTGKEFSRRSLLKSAIGAAVGAAAGGICGHYEFTRTGARALHIQYPAGNSPPFRLADVPR